MKKYLLLMIGLFLFAFINFSFGQGKVTPFKGSLNVNPDELGEPVQPGQPEEAATTTATISETTGDLQILQSDGTWMKASFGYKIKDGDTVKTGGKSTATTRFSSGGEITIGPNSEFKFNLRGQRGQSQYLIYGYIELSFGFIRIKGWILGGGIRTPEAIGAPRGTDFIVARDPDAKITNIYLYEGLMDVDNLHGKTMQLQPGDTLAVDGDGQMLLGKLSVEQWTQLTGEINLAETRAQTGELVATKSAWLWSGLIAAFLCTIGAGVYIYRKYR